MTTDRPQLLHPQGPEGNNARAARFEDQLVAMGSTLGWETVCRNADFVTSQGEHAEQRRGIDVLFALQNPHTGRSEGCLGEAKVHAEQATSSILRSEMQTLHTKINGISQRQSQARNEWLLEKIEDLRWGFVAHRTEGWDCTKATEHREGVSVTPLHKVNHVTTLMYIGPDTLEALADCFRFAGKPCEFLWPPTADDGVAWSRSCPPTQLAAGLMAYRNVDDGVVLWVKDGLAEEDVSAYERIVHFWGIEATAVVFSELRSDQLAPLRPAWETGFRKASRRRHGTLPRDVSPRNLKYAGLNAFDDVWPEATNGD